MEHVKFDNLNTFAYSTRPNTEAATWPDQVPENVKKDRLYRVQELAARHGLERSQRYLGRTVEVMVEDKNPRNPNQVVGRTRQGRQGTYDRRAFHSKSIIVDLIWLRFLKVYFDGDIAQLEGEFIDVTITEARTWSLMGMMESSQS